jgi:hypothetical protein
MVRCEPGDVSAHAERALGATGLGGLARGGFFWLLHGPSMPRAHMGPIQIADALIQIV